MRRVGWRVPAGVGLLFAIAEGREPWWTLASRVGVTLVVVVVVSSMVVAGRGRQRLRPREHARRAWDRITHPHQRRWWGGAGWVALALLVAGYDFWSFRDRSPRFPTLSRLIGIITQLWPGRSVAIALWLAIGVWIALANRSEAPRT